MFDGGGVGAVEEVPGAWEEADTGARDGVETDEASVGPFAVAGGLEAAGAGAGAGVRQGPVGPEAGAGPVAVEAGSGRGPEEGWIANWMRSPLLAGAIREYPAMVTKDRASLKASLESSSVMLGPKVWRKSLACRVSLVSLSVSSSDMSNKDTILTLTSRRRWTLL